jgi:hypothetical protein
MFRRQADGVAAERLLEADAQTILIASGDERRARGGADSRIRVALQKPGAACGDAIDVRRLQIGTAVAADVGVSEIVRHDVDDVGRRLILAEERLVHAGSKRPATEGSRAENITSRVRHGGVYDPGYHGQEAGWNDD